MKKSILSPPVKAEKKEETGSWYNPLSWFDESGPPLKHWPYAVAGGVIAFGVLAYTLGRRK